MIDVRISTVRQLFSELTLLILTHVTAGRITIVIALGFLAVVLSMSQLLDTFAQRGEFVGIVKESLLVGGGVAMWGPVEIFLYERWPIRAEARLFDQLAAMPVQTSYGATDR